MISMSELISSPSSLSEIHKDALGYISASSWGDEALETAKLSPEHFKIRTQTTPVLMISNVNTMKSDS